MQLRAPSYGVFDILRFALGIPLYNDEKRTSSFTCANVCVLQGTDLIKVSRFYKDSKEGKFVSFLYEDTRTLYDGFRKGAKVSSKFHLIADDFVFGIFFILFNSLI